MLYSGNPRPSRAVALVVFALIFTCCSHAPPKVDKPPKPTVPRSTSKLVKGVSFAVDAEQASPNVELRAFADRTVVISSAVRKGGDYGTRYIAIDRSGKVLWQRFVEHTRFIPRLAGAAGVVVGVDMGNLAGLSLRSGKLLWSYRVQLEPQHETRAAGDRVMVDAAHDKLFVLDATSGKETRRFDLARGALVAAGKIPKGVVALVVRGKRLLAQIVSGPRQAVEGLLNEPLRPLWSAPCGSSRALVVGEVVITSLPGGGAVGYALATGRERWRRPEARGLPLAAADGKAAARFGRLADGSAYVAAIDPATGLVRWSKRWPFPSALPRLIGGAQGKIAAIVPGGWRVYRGADGGLVAGGKAKGRAALAAAGDHALLLEDLRGSRTARVHTYGRGPADAQLGRPPARPRWLKAGVELTWRYALKGQRGKFTATVKRVAPDLTFAWKTTDGRQGTRIIPAAVLAGATQHSDLYRRDEGTLTLKRVTSVWVSRKVHGALVGPGKINWYDVTSGARATLARTGRSYHRVDATRSGGKPEVVDLPVVAARGSKGTGRYLIGDNAHFPLIVHAERKGFDVTLERIAVP